MYQSGSCTRLADFYIRWADSVEAAEDYRKTAEIFKIAEQMKAKPIEKLIEAQRLVLNLLLFLIFLLFSNVRRANGIA